MNKHSPELAYIWHFFQNLLEKTLRVLSSNQKRLPNRQPFTIFQTISTSDLQSVQCGS
jgi:hypothetical protein